MKRLFDTLVLNIPKYAFGFFAFLFSCLNILFTVRQFNHSGNIDQYFWGITFEHLLFIIIELFVLAIILKLNTKRNINKILLAIFFTLSLFVGIYWIFSNHAELIDMDDAYNCFRAAELIVAGDYGPLGYKSYVNTYPHNLPLISFFMIFIKIFGDSATTAIRLTNLMFVLLGYLYLYKSCDYLFKSDKTNTLMICLMYLSMQYVFQSFFIYGNAISYSLGIISIYYFLKYYREDCHKTLILSMILVVASIAIKNNSLIILVAELIFLFVKFVNTKNYKIVITSILTVLLYFVCTTGVIKFWEVRSGNDYSNKLPKICWIAYGLNYDEKNPGGYTNELQDYHHENGFVVEYTETRAKEFIDGVLTRFKEKPSLIPTFYTQKFLSSFTNPEYETFAQYGELPLSEFNESVVRGDINEILNNVWDGALSILSVGLLSWFLLNRKTMKLEHLFLGVIIFGGFAFHAIWETKAIYLYQYYLLILPYGAKGLNDLFEKLKGKLKHD